MSKLNENLKNYIANKGLRLSSYSKILGMKTSTVGNYLTGERMPDATALMKIFDADPNLSANYIMFGIGDMYLSKMGLSRTVDKYVLEDAAEYPAVMPASITEPAASEDPALVAALQARIKSQQDTINNLLEKLSQRDDMIKELVGKLCK